MIQFDCHAHVYERIQAVPGARYAPEVPAPLAAWRALQADHSIRGGVIVQVSFLGTDNSQLVTALSPLDRRHFAGVAVVELTVSDDDLAHLADSGVKAVRWNLVSGAQLPDLAARKTRRFVDALAAHGMHIEIQLESARLAEYLAPLSVLPVPVVIDHMGLPASPNPAHEPWLQAMDACQNRGQFFVKLSAPYRGKADPRRHLDHLLGLIGPDRYVWGSDWPHTRHEGVATYAGGLDVISGHIDDTMAVDLLYGLKVE
ncbi:amidohydrolase family protein [Roseovarius nanhaiticus]|uniref:amidohydrolase family protein n=1 Tax=Roseovarius nanhaiticus TaxID=573024 RepID=UPI002492481E|nr:amidohydrolase family protein [Roseovarius nanhaiticus]